VWDFLHGNRGGHVQSLILCAVFLVTGFQTWLIALVADLIAVNRRLSEDVLLRLKRMEMPRQEQRKPQRRDREQRPQPQAAQSQQPQQPQSAQAAPPPRPPREAAKPETQWVWLLDEDKMQDRPLEATTAAEEPEPEPEPPGEGGGGGNSRRRRRRRGGPRQHPELPGNRGKHVSGEND
jgi:hypothetical protein